MSLIEAIILGIVQGLTEFLPVSSSGHIELAQKILGADNLKDKEELLSVVLHAATALSTIIVFRKEILKICKGLFSGAKEELRFSIAIIISMVPAAIIGLSFDDIIESLFEGNLLLVGSMLIITSILLYLADKAKNTNKDVSFPSAFIIGLAQAIAILPGISRSGATISTSVLLGIDRSEAARFSFLMVVPLILGKMAKDILDGGFTMSADLLIPFSAGFIASFLTGIVACIWMIKLVKQAKLSWFAIYCLIVGVTAIIFSF
ncbi:MAG: undecaprenyl-diphosphate phosphatase [Bacteroidota bacterium]